MPLPSAAPPALTSEQQLQHVQQTVAPPGKRQPAATYLGVPAEAGGTTPRDEVWQPAHGHRNAFLVRDEEAATAGWVNPNNESGSNDARTQYLSMQMPHEEPAALRRQLAQRQRPASAGATHAARATPPAMVERPSSAAAQRSAQRRRTTDVRPASAGPAGTVGGSGVSFPVSHVATVGSVMSNATPASERGAE